MGLALSAKLKQPEVSGKWLIVHLAVLQFQTTKARLVRCATVILLMVTMVIMKIGQGNKKKMKSANFNEPTTSGSQAHGQARSTQTPAALLATTGRCIKLFCAKSERRQAC